MSSDVEEGVCGGRMVLDGRELVLEDGSNVLVFEVNELGFVLVVLEVDGVVFVDKESASFLFLLAGGAFTVVVSVLVIEVFFLIFLLRFFFCFISSTSSSKSSEDSSDDTSKSSDEDSNSSDEADRLHFDGIVDFSN